MDVKQLIKKLEKFYWSPALPQTYVFRRSDTGAIAGVGLVAYKDYGAFNLAWSACLGMHYTVNDHKQLVDSFIHYSHVIKGLEIDKVLASDWACLLGPEGFRDLLITSKLSSSVQEHLIAAIDRSPHDLR